MAGVNSPPVRGVVSVLRFPAFVAAVSKTAFRRVEKIGVAVGNIRRLTANEFAWQSGAVRNRGYGWGGGTRFAGMDALVAA